MRIAGLAAFIGIAALSVLAPLAPAGAADCKALVKPSPFGPDDQTGATNRVTAAVTKAAAAAARVRSAVPGERNAPNSRHPPSAISSATVSG